MSSLYLPLFLSPLLSTSFYFFPSIPPSSYLSRHFHYHFHFTSPFSFSFSFSITIFIFISIFIAVSIIIFIFPFPFLFHFLALFVQVFCDLTGLDSRAHSNTPAESLIELSIGGTVELFLGIATRLRFPQMLEMAVGKRKNISFHL